MRTETDCPWHGEYDTLDLETLPSSAQSSDLSCKGGATQEEQGFETQDVLPWFLPTLGRVR